jgi:hypothetical protein
MIDLRKRNLPNTVCVNGGFFSIKTDFREWLKFGELIKNKDIELKEFSYLFKNKIPLQNPFNELLEFYSNQNATPKKSESDDGKKVFDYILDGEYLVGSFWHAYGIDLTTIEELHWHTFQALFRSLPEDSKVMQIISRRAWKKTNKSMDSQLQEAKEIWSFPVDREMSDEELQKELMEEFYGTI